MTSLESRASVSTINSEDNAIITGVVGTLVLSLIALLNRGQSHLALAIDTGKFSNPEPPVLALPPTLREALNAIENREKPLA